MIPRRVSGGDLIKRKGLVLHPPRGVAQQLSELHGNLQRLAAEVLFAINIHFLLRHPPVEVNASAAGLCRVGLSDRLYAQSNHG
jgi:hypothetical protein